MREINNKSHLQEWVQKHDKVLPRYKIVSEKGPSHKKEFEIEVLWKRKIRGKGIGLTKKEAQQRAARDALRKIKINRRAI